jgi:hypothetical protein
MYARQLADTPTEIRSPENSRKISKFPLKLEQTIMQILWMAKQELKSRIG